MRPRPPRYALQLPPYAPTAASEHIRDRLGGISGASTAVRLLQSALAISTGKQYGQRFQHFADYCEREGVSALPATSATVICYLGHLAELGTWAESSMQPIFSAINDAHRSLEMEPPAVGSFFLKRARAGLGRVQAATSTVDSRTPLPAEAPIAFLDDADQQPDGALRVLREYAALTLTSLFSGRQDSSVHLTSSDLRVTDTEIWLRLTEKGKRHQRVRRIVRLPLDQPPVHGVASALPRVAALLRRYLALRAAAAPDLPAFAFQLPGEARPTTQTMEGWLAAALLRCGISAPPGFAYQGHSIRSMGTSAMAALGVPRHIYVWLGGWVRGSSVVDTTYIDPTFMPSPAAYALYGWALSRHYSADDGVVAAFAPLPDPRDEPPSPTLRETPPHERRAAARRFLALARAA